MEEVHAGFVLFLVQADHEFDVCDGFALGPAKGFEVGRPSCVECLPSAEVLSLGAADQHVGSLIPHDLTCPILLGDFAEVPGLPVYRVVDREVERESREDVPESLLASTELRCDARRRIHL